MGQAASSSTAREQAGLALLVLASVGVAWTQRFIQDDAFISMRYARNLTRGWGLVFNPEERVEGYTNFLWTLWLAIPLGLGVDPVGFSFATGMVLFAATLLLARQVTRVLLPESAAAPFIVLAILGTNHTFTSYATGGLETMLQTLLALAANCVAMSAPLTPTKAASASVLAGLAMLTRLDSPLLLVPGLVSAAVGLKHMGSRHRLAVVAAGIMPAVCLVGGWLSWKLPFYGSLIPNTFYLKTSSTMWVRGVAYVVDFALVTLLVFVIPLALTAWLHRVRAGANQQRAAWLGVGLCLVLWLGYVIATGGDFMEYRRLVAVFPWFALLITAGLLRLRPARRAIVLTVLVVVGLFPIPMPRLPGEPQSTHVLSSRASDWKLAGEELSRLSGAEPGVRIAVTAAGAVPYYSDLETVDLLGLCDSWVAQHGAPIPPRSRFAGNLPGHVRIATPDYLARRGVHLVLNHPWITSFRVGDEGFTMSDIEDWPNFSVSWKGTSLPRESKMIQIPIGDGRVMYALQLRAHAAVDEAVASGRWRAFPVRHGADPTKSINEPETPGLRVY